MEIFEALARRALGFDAVALIAFDVSGKWHRYMFQLTRQAPPPWFKQPSMTQLLRADRQAFVRMQELSRDGIRPLPDGTRPLDQIVQDLERDHSVVYYLLPTPLPAKDPKPPKNPKKEESWSQYHKKGSEVKKWNDKSQWNKSSGSGSGKLPYQLRGCASATADGSRICFAYNIGGCNDSEDGGQCRQEFICVFVCWKGVQTKAPLLSMPLEDRRSLQGGRVD